MRLSLLPLIGAIALTPLAAQTSLTSVAPQPGSPLIDYDGYAQLTREVRPIRAQRLLPVDQFTRLAKRKDVLLLDARSARAFAAGHIKGAKNLPFPDFTADSLAKLVGENKDRQILIYCNNNFRDNRFPVVTKSLPLALNIQTYVNLHGYGYTNVWELADAITMQDPRINWVKGG